MPFKDLDFNENFDHVTSGIKIDKSLELGF